jgi:hypothetical protein
MKVLLDECIPRKLKRELLDHDCRTVSEAGFAGQKNGRLLSLAENSGFQVFVTMDKGLEYQQNLLSRRIGILLIRASSNRFADLLPHVEACRLALNSIGPGELIRIGQ